MGTVIRKDFSEDMTFELKIKSYEAIIHVREDSRQREPQIK